MKLKIPSLIGVIHLPPLAGAPGSFELHPADALRRAGERAVVEARALAKAGFGGLILENFGDAPFYGARVPPETVASLAVIAAAVRESVRIPIGINVLRNDSKAALAIAAITGCDFIRVNVLAGVSATDQGLIEGTAAELVRERQRLGADIAILADARVKHARSLSADNLAVEIEDLALRSGADGVVITGVTTGRFADPETLEQALEAMRLHRIPVWIGSGATRDNVREIRSRGMGIIVGSDLRKDGRAGAPLESARIRAFVAGYKSSKKRAVASKIKSRTRRPKK